MSQELDDGLDSAAAAFEDFRPAADERETGFFQDDLDPDELQLRKGCRALRAADMMVHDPRLAEERFYAAAIELSFNAMERSCQAILIAAGDLGPTERRAHDRILAESHLAAVFDREQSTKLAALYDQNRAPHYYQQEVPSRTKALAAVRVATETHRLAAHSHHFDRNVCLCMWEDR